MFSSLAQNTHTFSHTHSHIRDKTKHWITQLFVIRLARPYLISRGVCASQVCTSVGQTVCSPLDAALCPRQHSAKSATDRTAVPAVSRCADGARNRPPSSDTTTDSIDCSGCAIARQLPSAPLTSTTTRPSGRSIGRGAWSTARWPCCWPALRGSSWITYVHRTGGQHVGQEVRANLVPVVKRLLFEDGNLGGNCNRDERT